VNLKEEKAMTYDDRPLYEQNKMEAQAMSKPESIKPRLPWADDVISKIKNSRYSPPSPIYTWFLAQKARQSRGEENELDMNRIKAALEGVRNEWYKPVQKNPDIFKLVADGKPHNWLVIRDIGKGI
jgi:hypothetical protein